MLGLVQCTALQLGLVQCTALQLGLVQCTALHVRILLTGFQEGAGDVFLRLADTRQVL